MVEYISRESLDTKELLAKISRKEINSDHFVIGLRTKERERISFSLRRT